jgi:antitoxin (DNA-binding transcriptional repressor) of toxin-antitoxin stability system
MRVVGAFEAKTKLSELLDLVEAGEEIQITRHGKVVASLGAPRASRDPARVKKALDMLKEVRQRSRPGGSLKELIEEGRRY